jgi:hypothetical protein
MTDENTKDLTTDEKLDLILAELADLREWRVKVDSFIEDHLPDTRPLHERTVKEMIETRELLLERSAAIEREVKTARREIGLLREDIRNERMERVELAERVSAIEQRPN